MSERPIDQLDSAPSPESATMAAQQTQSLQTDPNEAAYAEEPSAILHTDALQRRNIGVLLGLMALACGLFFLIGLPLLKRWINVGDLRTVLHRIGILFYCMSALALVMAVGAAYYARRIFRSDAFPPTGSWVWRDTAIKRGQQARIRGWWVVACAAVFTLIAAYLAFLPSRVGGLSSPPAEHALLTPAR